MVEMDDRCRTADASFGCFASIILVCSTANGRHEDTGFRNLRPSGFHYFGANRPRIPASDHRLPLGHAVAHDSELHMAPYCGVVEGVAKDCAL